ncbi:apolipoprotein D-like [Panonychus citri]|uniref:apolipoprotein D-like n=1 Tax=Panonychus citri TaxID=50023 RepID=UPI002307ED42|nr:apolipoprotein D-like [Panonychus citri]
MICKIVIAFISLVGLASCQIYDIGTCPLDQSPAQFQMDKFYGKWYEIARVENGVVAGETCVTFNISSQTSYLSGHPVTQTGYDKTGKLEYVYIGNLETWDDNFLLEYGEYPYGFNILDTDYDNYAVVLGCGLFPPLGYWFPFLLVRVRVAWILSRTPTIDHALQAQLIKTLTSGGVGKSKLIFPSTVNCPANY